MTRISLAAAAALAVLASRSPLPAAAKKALTLEKISEMRMPVGATRGATRRASPGSTRRAGPRRPPRSGSSTRPTGKKTKLLDAAAP